MPMITLRYATPRQQQAGLADTVAQAINQLSAQILGKNSNITAVVVDEVDPARWFVGKQSLKEHGLASFWVDIRVVDGTNTREEKADFIAAVFVRMQELIGPLHSESYIYVNEVRGDAYGYGGVTQNERYIAGKLDRPGQAAA
jgi:4-oxalocrotonate tautomerase